MPRDCQPKEQKGLIFFLFLANNKFRILNIKLFTVGKTDSTAISTLVSDYEKRLKPFINLKIEMLADVKNAKSMTEAARKIKEGEMILEKISSSDHLVLLDERGKMFTSLEFSENIQKQMNSGVKTVVFVIGGPYGFSDAVYERSNAMVSLSQMTFSHQMVRLFFVEQLYRAFAILNNLPYHHE